MQAQLIQADKMSSLGQLVAGIAISAPGEGTPFLIEIPGLQKSRETVKMGE